MKHWFKSYQQARLVLLISRLTPLVTELCRKMHLQLRMFEHCHLTRLLVQLLERFFLFFFPFDFSTLLSSSSLLLLLSPACNTKARSPLESSVPCLATRTLDDEIRVQRSPSVGWLSKLGQGDRGAGWATALCWGDTRKSNGKFVLIGVLMLAAVLTLGRLEAHSWWNGCCSVCPFTPTVPILCSFFTILLFSLAFPICAGTGRSACTPVQAVVSLLTHLAKFHTCIEVCFGC